MIGYATLGTNDPARAKAFYDALLGMLGAKRLMDMPDDREMTLYGTGMDRPMLGVTRPYDGGEATPGNGGMLALMVDGRAQVDAAYAKAMELGGADEGAPGVRGPEAMGFYGAYFRDPDGNKIALFHIGAA